jgi:sRNA-binding carbon storage regulator CsrA
MVFVRVHRHAIEVLAKAPVKAATFRQEIEVAIQDDGTGQVDVHRHGVEVLAKFPDTAQVSRQEIEVAVQDDGTGQVDVHRHSVEVIAKAPSKVATNRQEIEVAVQDLGTGGLVQVHRHGIEVLARRAVPPITPLTYPTGLDFFLHNWVANVDMETRYLTDITRSPTTLAEERRGLLQRPQRLLKTRWLHGSKAEVGRLLHNLRRLTEDNLMAPLYQDTVVVTTSGTGQANIYGDFRYRRFYDGGRVAVFTQAPTSESLKLAADVDVYQIEAVYADRIEVERNLDQAYANNTWFIVPLMDLEIMLKPKVTQLTDDTAEVALTLNEVVGKNALPPSSTGGVPDGWQQQLGLPVFEINPDWADGITTTYHRYGQRRVEGRKPVVVTNGDRYVQQQDFKLKLEREDYWHVMNLFDSRRGRLDTFWEVDQEFLWTVVDTDPTFIDVTPPTDGIFSEFQSEFTDHCGIVMNDGTVYIREVFSISDTGSWRITLAAGNPLPDPIDVTQIKRFSRARVKRFDQDSIPESWHTTELVDVEFTTIEVLNETEVDI